MLRKVLSIITIIVALILLFLLVRTLVHTFTGKPKVTSLPTSSSSIAQKAKDDGAEAIAKAKAAAPTPPTPAPAPTPVATTTTTNSTVTNPANGASTSGTNSSTKLTNTGPGETAMFVMAGTSAVGAMYMVRRKQLANL